MIIQEAEAMPRRLATMDAESTSSWLKMTKDLPRRQATRDERLSPTSASVMHISDHLDATEN